jgi:hypothetical protein
MEIHLGILLILLIVHKCGSLQWDDIHTKLINKNT